MHTIWLRINAVISHAATVAMFIAAFLALINPIQLDKTSIKASLSVQEAGIKFGKHDLRYWNKRNKEFLFARVAITADFQELLPEYKPSNNPVTTLTSNIQKFQSGRWNLNAKQLTVFVVVKYTTPELARNEAVLWYEIVNINELGYASELDFISKGLKKFKLGTVYAKRNWQERVNYEESSVSNSRYSHWALPVYHLPQEDLDNWKNLPYKGLRGASNFTVQLRYELGPQIGMPLFFTAKDSNTPFTIKK